MGVARLALAMPGWAGFGEAWQGTGKAGLVWVWQGVVDALA